MVVMMLNLKPEYLITIRKILAEHVPTMIVWAYGSRISGSSHGGSDLDLVVINPQASTKPQNNIAELRDAFSESELPILVDVMDWAQIPESFRQEIKRRYSVVQEP